MNKDNLITIGFYLAVLWLVVNGFFWFISNKPGIKAHCNEVKNFLANNDAELKKAFTETFDQAVKCQNRECERQLLREVHRSLHGTNNVRFFGTSYFIRLNGDGNIEKWFWSGDIKTTIPETKGERKVAQVLQGDSRAICTQSWKLDAGLTYMTYLKDEYAEAETIIPFYDNGKVVGALVSRFGD